MDYNEINRTIRKKQSFLCIGLDTDINKIPRFLLTCDEPVFEFNKQIIDATHDICVAYKPNIAFYESRGCKGWRALERTVQYIRSNYPGIFMIADAKRGDIGNTAQMYAKTFFETFDFDAVTVNPYMGKDSVTPFLEYKNKWTIILALTSNPSAADFQYCQDKNTGDTLFETILKKAQEWGDHSNTMFVVGATKAGKLKEIRQIAQHHFLLVPGIGKQGGSLTEVAQYGQNESCGLLVNSSRGIIYAGMEKNFASVARQEAKKIQENMKLSLHINN